MTNFQKIIDEWVILGRPGYAGKKKQARRKEVLEKFGEGNYKIAHLVNGNLLSREQALVHFEHSYEEYFVKNPEILEWLVQNAEDVYDTSPTNVESGLDYSIQETDAAHLHDISIRRVLKKMGREFLGDRLIEIRGDSNEGYFLTTGQVPFYKSDLILNPQLKGWWNKNSMESYWQSNKVLAVKFKSLQKQSRQMVGVVLRKDIKMGKGKFSAQTAHALVTLFPQRNRKWDFTNKPPEIWTVNSEENLLGILSKSQKMKIENSLIRDAGKTQIAAGTKTAVGLGPILEADYDKLMCEYDAKPLVSIPRKYLNFKEFTLQKLKK